MKIKALMTFTLLLAWFATANAMPATIESQNNGEIVYQEPELPQAVRDALAEKFPGHKINEVEKEEESGKTIYEVDLEWNGEQWEVEFDPEGKIIEKERADEDDVGDGDDDDDDGNDDDDD